MPASVVDGVPRTARSAAAPSANLPAADDGFIGDIFLRSVRSSLLCPRDELASKARLPPIRRACRIPGARSRPLEVAPWVLAFEEHWRPWSRACFSVGQ